MRMGRDWGKEENNNIREVKGYTEPGDFKS